MRSVSVPSIPENDHLRECSRAFLLEISHLQGGNARSSEHRFRETRRAQPCSVAPPARRHLQPKPLKRQRFKNLAGLGLQPLLPPAGSVQALFDPLRRGGDEIGHKSCRRKGTTLGESTPAAISYGMINYGPAAQACGSGNDAGAGDGSRRPRRHKRCDRPALAARDRWTGRGA